MGWLTIPMIWIWWILIEGCKHFQIQTNMVLLWNRKLFVWSLFWNWLKFVKTHCEVIHLNGNYYIMPIIEEVGHPDLQFCSLKMACSGALLGSQALHFVINCWIQNEHSHVNVNIFNVKLLEQFLNYLLSIL